MPKAVAEQPDDRAFLVRTRANLGRVVDLATGRVFEEHLMDAILARGYWEPISDAEGAKEAEALAREAFAALGAE